MTESTNTAAAIAAQLAKEVESVTAASATNLPTIGTMPAYITARIYAPTGRLLADGTPEETYLGFVTGRAWTFTADPKMRCASVGYQFTGKVNVVGMPHTFGANVVQIGSNGGKLDGSSRPKSVNSHLRTV